jgi:hypothetical protein
MNRVHVIGQHNDANHPIFINHYIAEEDRYEYLSRISVGGLDRIRETPLETINYIKGTGSTFKIELLYD